MARGKRSSQDARRDSGDLHRAEVVYPSTGGYDVGETLRKESDVSIVMLTARTTEEAMLLERLINDLQELALAEANRLGLEPQAVSIATEVEQAVSSFGVQAAEKQVSLESAAPADLPMACADPNRVRQVLANLLGDAIGHTPAGGEIKVTARLVDSSRPPTPDHRSLRVAFIFKQRYTTSVA